MATTKSVELHKSFAYRGQDDVRHYFTRQNAQTILEILTAEDLPAYEQKGLFTITDVEVADVQVDPNTPET